MAGDKQVYREAFERALDGKSRTLWQRILFPFQDQYTRYSRQRGERDGVVARAEAQRGEGAPRPAAVE